MAEYFYIGSLQITRNDLDYLVAIQAEYLCVTDLYSVPVNRGYNEGLYEGLTQAGYTCYSLADLFMMLESGANIDTGGGGGGGEPPPPDTGGGPVTDPGIEPPPPPVEIPPDPPPVVIPPPPPPAPPVVIPFPQVYPGIQIGANGLPFLPGGTIAIRVFNGLGGFLGALLGTFGVGAVEDEVKRLRYDVVNVVNAIWTGIKALKGVVDAIARAVGAAIGTLHKLWHDVIQPILDHIKEITRRINAIINKVLKPYLDWMKRVRAIILAVYTKIVLPILNVIQGIRKAVALLRLAHVPFAKKLDEKLQRLEAKLTAPIQWLLQQVNDHGGIINEIISIQRVLQEPLFTGSIYSYQYNLVNSWWASQTTPHTAQQQQQVDQLEQFVVSQPHTKALNGLLQTGIYVPPFPPGPKQIALTNLLQRGPE